MQKQMSGVIVIPIRTYHAGSTTPAAGIRDFARRVGFTPDAAQAGLLATTSRRIIVNSSRQSGKTTTTALRVAFHAFSRPGAMVVISSPSGRQSGEFVIKAAVFLRRLGLNLKGDGVNRGSILLPNGSRIVGIPNSEATTRGLSGVTMLVIDEASRAPDSLYNALRPMLATTGGEIWLLSTPNGKRGFFYEVWTHGGPAWERHSVPASECPRISPDFLEEERQSLSEDQFMQEYFCQFLLGEGLLFDRALLDAAITETEHAWKDWNPR
jgi:phage FluMu gp28-like protein